MTRLEILTIALAITACQLEPPADSERDFALADADDGQVETFVALDGSQVPLRWIERGPAVAEAWTASFELGGERGAARVTADAIAIGIGEHEVRVEVAAGVAEAWVAAEPGNDVRTSHVATQAAAAILEGHDPSVVLTDLRGVTARSGDSAMLDDWNRWLPLLQHMTATAQRDGLVVATPRPSDHVLVAVATGAGVLHDGGPSGADAGPGQLQAEPDEQAACCFCQVPGRSCGACCFPDQTPDCQEYDGACGCYCENNGGGGEGGFDPWLPW